MLAAARFIGSPLTERAPLQAAHEAVRFGGFGAEVAAQIQEDAFDYLDAPVGRIGAPFSPVLFMPALENLYVPDAARIAQGVRDALARPLHG